MLETGLLFSVSRRWREWKRKPACKCHWSHWAVPHCLHAGIWVSHHAVPVQFIFSRKAARKLLCGVQSCETPGQRLSYLPPNGGLPPTVITQKVVSPPGHCEGEEKYRFLLNERLWNRWRSRDIGIPHSRVPFPLYPAKNAGRGSLFI